MAKKSVFCLGKGRGKKGLHDSGVMQYSPQAFIKGTKGHSQSQALASAGQCVGTTGD